MDEIRYYYNRADLDAWIAGPKSYQQAGKICYDRNDLDEWIISHTDGI